MIMKFLKWLPVLAASAMLYGNTQEEIVDSCCPPPKPACPPAPCCKPVPVKPLPPCTPCVVPDPCCPPMQAYNRNINPPVRCAGMCPYDLFATAAFLWWTADEADFSLAFKQQTDYVPSVIGTAGSAANGNVVQFDYKWKPGFRVGAGWQSHTVEGWDVYLNWTWFKGKASEHDTTTTSAAGQGFVPYWGFYEAFFGGVTGTYGQIDASWRLLYNMIDLELGRDFFVSCGLSLRPYVSVEGGWINRRWSVSYSNRFLTDDLLFGTDTYSTKSNYWGIGPRAGLSGNWWLGQGFKFFGNLSGAILTGKVNKNTTSFAHTNTLTLLPQANSITNNSHLRIVPHLQAIVGFGWDTCFSCNDYGLGLSLGWEVNQFWNVPMALYPDRNTSPDGTGYHAIFNRESRSHNVGLSGLTAEVRFDF